MIFSWSSDAFFYIVDFNCEEGGASENCNVFMYSCSMKYYRIVELEKKRIILIEVFPIITVDFC